MFLLGFRRKLTALALCKSIEATIQWFQIHNKITFATIQNPAVYLSGARVSIFSTLVPRLLNDFDLLSPHQGTRGGAKEIAVVGPIHVSNSHTKFG